MPFLLAAFRNASMMSGTLGKLRFNKRLASDMMDSYRTLFLRSAFLLAVLASSAVWTQDAAPAGDPATPPKVENADSKAPAAPQESEKKAATPAPATTPAAPAGPLPKYPLKSEWFDQIEDKVQPIEADDVGTLDKHSLEVLLLALKNSPPEYLERNISPSVKFRQLMLNAEEYRGHVVQLRGLFEYERPFPIDENASGVTHLYRGHTSNMSGEIVTYLSLEPIAPAMKRKSVRLTGIFMKRYTYLTRDAGEHIRWTPLIVIHKAEPIREAEESDSDPMMTIMTVIISIMITLGLVAYFYGKMKEKASGSNHFSQMKAAKQGPRRIFPGSK